MISTRNTALLILLFASFYLSAIAQEVTYKKGIVYKDKVPYCQMELIGSIVKDYKISTLEGEEIMVLRYNTAPQDYTITFRKSLKQGTYIPDWAFTKMLAKEIIATDLIKDGQFNPEGEDYFLTLHPLAKQNIGSGLLQSITQDEKPIVARNRNTTIFIIGNEIRQDNITIGQVNHNTESRNGDLYNSFQFSNANGQIVAMATIKGIGAKTATIITTKNNQQVLINLNSFDNNSLEKEIAKWLIDRLYL